ncbi:MAG: electron transport complex subunit RsxG [Gammaproteobacteria bacterium]|nr:electron transport complex subunit RsxG [Gammaproteobacteria bacterium]
MRSRQILTSSFTLWLFAVIGVGFVAVTEHNTHEKIAGNERRALLRNLHALLPTEKFDNDITTDTQQLTASALLGTDSVSTVYRARLGNESIAIVFNSIALHGYNGRIHLLIGVYRDGSLAGVRAIKHSETPGLGDGIEIRKSDWITGFNYKSIGNPDLGNWAVKRDGGEFEQFTGATITPRAIVEAVKNTLLYYRDNANTLFD